MRGAARQPDLFAWEPPSVVRAFEPALVRGQTLRARLARGVTAALADAAKRGLGREEIARRMSAWLGEAVSKPVLDAYASQAREDHTISLPRFLALVHATEDQRLLELLAAPMGWVVVERRYLPLIELATVQEAAEELRGRAEALRRRARAERAL